MKVCSKCLTEKTLNEFPERKDSPDGHRNECILCKTDRQKKWQRENRDAIKEKKRKRYIENRGSILLKCKEYSLKNAEKKRLVASEWYADHKERHYEYNKKWREEHRAQYEADNKRRYAENRNEARIKTKQWAIDNPERYKEQQKRYREEHPGKVKLWNRRYTGKIYATPKGNLNSRIASGIYISLARGSKGKRKWESLVGYTVDQLREHIENQFKQGMSWERFLMGDIHIDHKIPKVAFNFKTPEDIDFKRCWALNNLQPLWAIDNLKKHDRLDIPFQPSLTI